MKLVLALLALFSSPPESLDRIVADAWQYRLDREPALPLSVLEQHVEWWIAQEKAR